MALGKPCGGPGAAMSWPAIVNLVVFAGMLAVNGLAITRTSSVFPNAAANVADRHPTPISLASYSFAYAWGAVYLLLLAFATRFLWTTDRRLDLDILFPVTCFLNAGWFILISNDYVSFALIVIGALWASLLAIWTCTRVFKPVRASVLNVLTVLSPFSLYFGWVTVLACTNAAVVVSEHKVFTDLDAEIAIGVVTVLGLLALSVATDVVYVVGALWGLIAMSIEAKVQAASLVQTASMYAISALVGGVVVRLGTYVVRGRRHISSGQQSPAVSDGRADFLSIQGL
ncbi:hypothetical protein PBRA_007641 [Plasmodiophora brassicae]|nr:hypothetical protein PBRA_007641 [Plasmodiophora brassicae]